MKLINEKGKLFGVINVIDLLVILFAIVLVLFGGYAYLQNKGKVPSPSELMRIKNSSVFKGPTTTLEMEYYVEEVNDFVVDGIFIGAELFDDTSSEYLGTVTKFETGPSETYGINSDGQNVRTSKEGIYSLKITGEVVGQRTPTGATIGSSHYGEGHSMVLRAGDAKIYLRVSEIRAAQRRLRRPVNEGQILYEDMV